MPSGKVTTKSSTKSFGSNIVSKTSDSFSINAAGISISLASLPNEKNVQSAMDRITNKTAASAAAPGSPEEGDIWYDTDDDEFYVRDEDSWNEVVTSVSGTVDGGSY
tara:strand:- start:419 stop:739 length:321 start_codon:yes stop_codon:yes gene_type:complete